MAYKVDGDIALETRHRVVGMNGTGAGSGGKGPVEHGRWGEGLTVSLDLVRGGMSSVQGVYQNNSKITLQDNWSYDRHFGPTYSWQMHGMHAVSADFRRGCLNTRILG
jgi:hypothetical protein